MLEVAGFAPDSDEESAEGPGMDAEGTAEVEAAARAVGESEVGLLARLYRNSRKTAMADASKKD